MGGQRHQRGDGDRPHPDRGDGEDAAEQGEADQGADQNGDLLKNIAAQPWGAVQPGDIRYKDQNGDGKINEDDLTKIGEPVAAPRIIYGFSPSVRYKGIALELLFQGAAKASWYYHPSAVMPFWETMLPYRQNFDYWTPQNTDAAYPRLTSLQLIIHRLLPSGLVTQVISG